MRLFFRLIFFFPSIFFFSRHNRPTLVCPVPLPGPPQPRAPPLSGGCVGLSRALLLVPVHTALNIQITRQNLAILLLGHHLTMEPMMRNLRTCALFITSNKIWRNECNLKIQLGSDKTVIMRNLTLKRKWIWQQEALHSEIGLY